MTSHVTAVTFLRGYLGALRQDGWDVTLICSPGVGVDELAEREGTTVYMIPMRRSPSPIRDLISLVRLGSRLARLKPDVVVYATPKASLLTAIAATLVGVRVRIYELWGLRLETTTGLAFRILRATERLTAKLSTGIVANSPSLARRAKELQLLGKKDAVVLGAGSSHGVDTTRFSREAWRPDLDPVTNAFLEASSGLVVGFVGRLHPDKGIDTLLRALEVCARRGVSIRALLVGGNEGASIATLLERLEGLVPVHRTGDVADPRPYIAAMDALVLMSLREGFPNVVLEAAAMEVPAIVADTTGTIDSVIDGKTGYVVTAGDVEELSRRFEVLHSLPLQRSALGQRARARVVAEFSQEQVWRLHSEFFASQGW